MNFPPIRKRKVGSFTGYENQKGDYAMVDTSNPPVYGGKAGHVRLTPIKAKTLFTKLQTAFNKQK